MLPEHAKLLIEKTAKENGLRDWSYFIEPGSKKGDNYIGVIYRVIVTGSDAEGTDAKLSLIVKLAPENAIRREKYQVVDCFAREAFIYKEVLPEMTLIQELRRVETSERFPSDLKCHDISLEDGKECMIMEDLTVRGYRMWDRSKSLDLDHALLAMESLGKFHGLSFALKDQRSTTFAKFQELRDVVFSNEEYFAELIPYFNLFVDRSIGTLNENEREARSKMLEFKDKFMKIMFDGVKGSLAEPYAVVCHGDCWTNNMMFKYENGKPVSLILLDWQIARYSSPVTDINYTIFCCTDKHLRDASYDLLIKHYHTSLANHVRALGSDADKLFPYKALQDQLKMFSKYSLGMTIYDLPNMIAHAEDIKDLDGVLESLEKGAGLEMESFDSLTAETEPIYRERMRDVILDCIKYEFL